MRRIADLLFRVRAVFGADRMERDLDEELQFHIEMETDKYIRQGDAPEVARARAERAFGNATRRKQAIRDGWGVGLVRDAVNDLRHATRQLRRNPGFTVTVLLTLALGIGATTAIASLVRQVLLRHAPVAEPSQLAALYTSCRRGDLRCSSSYPDFIDYRDRSRLFTGMVAASPLSLNIGTEGSARLVTGEVVSEGFFEQLGLSPSLGRLLMPGDGERGNAQAVAVVSHDFWREAFGGDSSIVGRDVLINGAPFTVVGVGPAGYRGLSLTTPRDVWLPMLAATFLGPSGGSASQLDNYDSRNSRWISTIIGRLAPGATIEGARQEMAGIAAQLGEEYPEERAAIGGPRKITVDPAGRFILPVGREAELRNFLALLVGTVLFTLVLACANIANLLLARATARGRELGVQLAIGASRGRVVRMLLTESILLGVLGAAAGLLVAAVMIRWLSAYELPGGVGIGAMGVTMDGTVLTFALLLAVGTAMLFGLVPALHASRQDLVGVIRGDLPRREGMAITQVRRGLVALQVGLCLVLLAGSAIFARTVRNSLDADLGFDGTGTVQLRYNAGLLGMSPEQQAGARRVLLDRVRAIPGASAASLASLTPLQGAGFQGFFAEIDGYAPKPDEEIRFDAVFVSAGYFAAQGMTILEGRPIEDQDASGAPPVALVNQYAARRYWGDRSAIGGRLRLPDSTEVVVVGVVADPTWDAIGEETTPFVFVSLDQFPQFASRGFLTLSVRGPGDGTALIPAVRGAFREVFPGLSPSRVGTMTAQVESVLMPQRLGSLLLTIFGGLTLLLAGVGIYGVVGYNILRQARELGIRIAVGASSAAILRTVVVGMTGPILLGLAAGLVAVVVLGRTVTGFLYQVGPADPASLAVAAGALVLVALVALLIPAWRATRIDPAKVLMAE